MITSRDAEYITDKDVFDPKSKDFVTIEIWRDPYTGRLFGIESEHVVMATSHDQPGEVNSLYHEGAKVKLRSI